jgi:hypothetical protein
MTRKQALTEAGLVALGKQASPGEQRLVRAFAEMFDKALGRDRGNGAKKHAPPVDLSGLPYSPGAVYEDLLKHCPEKIQLEPYEKNSFGRLGKTMLDIAGLEEADLHRVTAWIQSGGLNWWTIKPNWSHVVRHYASWVTYARAWEAAGGGTVEHHYGLDAWR